MDWSYISQIALAIVGSFGGASVIILAVSRWLANLTADKMLKKTEFKFSKELEDFKSRLEHKNYVSKARFDLEIEVYRQLSEATLSMVFDISALFPYGLESIYSDEEQELERKQENYRKSIASYTAAAQAITKNAPFIPQPIYELFCDIRDACARQIHWYPDFRLGRLNEEIVRELNEEKRQCWERTKVISDKLDALLNTLRNHISAIDVMP